MIKYLLIIISVLLNVVFVVLFLMPNNNITRTYSTKLDGSPEYIEKTEMPNGEIVERILVEADLVQEIAYFSDGKIKEIRNYNNSQKHGEWIMYYQSSDVIDKKRKKQYSNYDSGKLLEIVDYAYNGSIRKLSVPMSENILMITNYYLNGQIESSGKVRLVDSGKKIKFGPWIWYNQEGFVIQEKIIN